MYYYNDDDDIQWEGLTFGKSDLDKEINDLIPCQLFHTVPIFFHFTLKDFRNSDRRMIFNLKKKNLKFSISFNTNKCMNEKLEHT